MITPIRPASLAGFVAAVGLALAGCTGTPVSEMPAALTSSSAAPAASPASATAGTPTPQAKPAAATATAARAKPIAEKGDVTPMDQAEANAQCWMKYDKSNVSLEAKAALVDKCAAEKMKGR